MDKRTPETTPSSQHTDRTTWILPLRHVAYRDSVLLLEQAGAVSLGWSGALRTIILTGPPQEVQRWGELLLRLDQRVALGASLGILVAEVLGRRAA